MNPNKRRKKYAKVSKCMILTSDEARALMARLAKKLGKTVEEILVEGRDGPSYRTLAGMQVINMAEMLEYEK